MAVAFDAQSSADIAGFGASFTNSTNLTVGSGANRALTILIAWSGSALPTGVSITWNGAALSLVANTNIANSSGHGSVAIYALLNPASGTNTLAGSWTGNIDYYVAGVSFTGVDQTSVAVAFPNGISATNGTSATALVVTSATGNMAVAAMATDGSFTAITSGTQIFLDNSLSLASGVGIRNNGAATVTLSATANNGFAGGACDVKAASTVASLTATNIASAAAGFANGKPVFSSLSANNLITTPPHQDASVRFGAVLMPALLASKAGALGKPAAVIRSNLSAVPISSNAAGIGQPVVMVVLTAASLTTGSAGLDQPGVSFSNISAIRSISTSLYVSSTNVVLTPPAGLANNDILLAFIANSQIGAETNTSISPASGFTQIGTDQVVVNGSNTFLRGAVYWKRANSESGSYIFPTASGNSEGILIAINGAVSSGPPTDVSVQQSGSTLITSTTAGATQSLNASASSITTNAVDDLVIYLTSAFSGYASAAAPVGINTIFNDIQNGVIFAGWEPERLAGSATGTVSMQINSTSNPWLAYLIGIKSNFALNALNASNLATGADGLGQPVFGQTDILNTANLTTGSAGPGVPVFTIAGAIVALPIGTASPGFGTPLFGSGSLLATSLATGADGIGVAALSSRYPLTATPLTAGGAGMGQAAINQRDVFTASTLAAGTAGLDAPLFAQNNVLVSTNLASQSAGIRTANYNQSGAGIAMTLASAAAGLGIPAFNQSDVLTANLLASGSPAGTTPVIGSAIVVTNLATGSAGFGSNKPALHQIVALIANNLASQASIGAVATFSQSVFVLSALPISSQASTAALAALTQTKNTLAAVSLVTQGAFFDQPPVGNAHLFFNSIVNYGTTSPVNDVGLPTLTLTSAYNFGSPVSLTAGSASINQPAINQQQVINAAIIAAGAAGIDQPQFVQFQALLASNLASGAIFMETPGVGNTASALTGQLNFSSVDANIQQLNNALTGIAPAPLLTATVTAIMLNTTSMASVSNIAASAAIAIPNMAAMSNAAALVIQLQEILMNQAILSAGSLLQANAATFIFDNEIFAPVIGLQATTIQLLSINNGPVVAASMVVKEVVTQTSSTSLSGGAALFANPVKQGVTQWAGSAALTPASALTSFVIQGIAASITFGVASSLKANAQLDIFATGLTPVSTLRAAAFALMPTASTVSSAASVTIAENIQASLYATLVPAATVTTNEQLLVRGKALLNIGVAFQISFTLPKPLNIGLVAEAIMLPVAVMQTQTGKHLASCNSLLTAAEFQLLAANQHLTPLSTFGIKSQTMMSPSVLWGVQSSLAVNERILPEGSAFYFAHSALFTVERQVMMTKVTAPLQAQLLPHEGLQMMQAPMIAHAAAAMTVKEYSLQQPIMQLFNDTILNIKNPISLVATQSSLVNQINLQNQFALCQSSGTGIKSSTTIPAFFNVVMAGGINLSPGCYFDTDTTTMQQTTQTSAMITAQVTRTRIVAKGNLVRQYK